ncbi:hypothetical protein MKEN_00644500 [Mycena kentingensis (nom. inval.)]|nr:hypothetical protein MKEN_00644500 [Mycena kentingensis (nom. inval.)]
MSNIYSYQQLDAYAAAAMESAAAGYYQEYSHSAGSSPSSPSHPLVPLSMAGPSPGPGPTRTHITRKRGPDSPYELPLDASTVATSRSYPFPSRKDVSAPAAAFRFSDEEEDELTEEPPAVNASEQEKIEYKRRQNTLAARRSRKRKLMHQQALEEAVERLTREREIWRTRALMLANLLRSHGITCPEFGE